jgi:hypothetical protein
MIQKRDWVTYWEQLQIAVSSGKWSVLAWLADEDEKHKTQIIEEAYDATRAHPYPAERPPEEGDYLVQWNDGSMARTVETWKQTASGSIGWFVDYGVGHGSKRKPFNVVAWWHLPAPVALENQ